MTSPATTGQPRNARGGCSDSRSPIHIRRSHITDLPRLRKMARLEDRTLAAGTFLVAEVPGNIVAAAPLDADAPALGTPHLCSEQLQCLLRRQARFVRSSREGRSSSSPAPGPHPGTSTRSVTTQEGQSLESGCEHQPTRAQ